MKLAALIDMEKVVMKEVVRRRSLGGYNSEAESLLVLSEVILNITRHIIEEYNVAAEPETQHFANKKKPK